MGNKIDTKEHTLLEGLSPEQIKIEIVKKLMEAQKRRKLKLLGLEEEKESKEATKKD